MAPGTIDSEHFSEDLQELFLLLAKHEVRYLIVGGEAVIYYGHARLTGDLDVFYEFTPENCSALFTALEEFWAGCIPGFTDPRDFQEGLIVQFGVPPNRLDLLNKISGVTFEEAWPGRLEVQLRSSGTKLNYIGKDALLKNKAASGRPKDLQDIVFLLQSSD